MNTFAPKSTTEIPPARAYPISRATESAADFIDNRPEAIAQRKLQDVMNRSPQVQRLAQRQDEMNKSHRVQASAQFQVQIGNSPRQVAQRKQIARMSGPVMPLSFRSPLPPAHGTAPGLPVQRAKREAQVTWAITHLVRVQNPGEDESLFGKDDDWRSGEIAPDELGQLSHGQLILVDDEAVFMSRRGANQENQLRRGQDRETDELKHKWFKVLAVWADGRLEKAPDDAYVRAETIKIIDAPEQQRQKIALQEHGPKDERTVSGDLEEFHRAWHTAASKRRRSIGRVKMEFGGKKTPSGDAITSGWNWDKYDEGENVSGDMKDPDERERFEGVEEQHTISAGYDGGDRVAYMVLEVRNEGKESYMYIRWLIAHPEKGGGGSALMKEAIRRFTDQNKCQELRVDSAFSAVAWYESQKFKKRTPGRSAVSKGVGYADTELVYTKPTSGSI